MFNGDDNIVISLITRNGMLKDIRKLLIQPGRHIDLSKFDPDDTFGKKGMSLIANFQSLNH
jgi:hypothetical protein